MSTFQNALREAIAVFESLGEHQRHLEIAAGWCIDALRSKHKLLICGNGGSASEAQHLAGELMGRYKENRRALPAIALASDTAILTCIGNDYSFEDAFSRQLSALGQPGDVLIVFTTSGNSPNVLSALREAQALGLKSIAFLGKDGGKAKSLADCPIIVRHSDTARAQEGHQFLMHCLMDHIEASLTEEDTSGACSTGTR